MDFLILYIGAVVVALAILVFVLFGAKRNYQINPAPGFPWTPFLGHAIDMMKVGGELRDMLVQLAKDNDQKSFFIAVPSQKYRVIVPVEEVEHTLKTNFPNYVKGPVFFNAFEELLGNGIFSIDGKEWQNSRKAASHMFSLRRLKDHAVKAFQDYAQVLVDQLDLKAKSGEAFDLQSKYYAYTFDAFSKIAFGQEMHCLTKGHPFSKAFDTTNAVCAKRTQLIPAMWKFSRFFGLGTEGTIKEHVKTLDKEVNSVIQARKKAHEEGEVFGSDLLGLFVESYSKRNAVPTDAEIRDTVLNFIIAGRDTTAWTMTAMSLVLSKHPDILARVIKELDDVMGDEDIPTFEMLEKLTYLQACMFETLRLYPSVPIQIKYAVDADTLPNGDKIEKGEAIIYSSYMMGRLDSIWDRPDEFDPQRWLDNEFKISDCKYPIFNIGKRNCLGKPMAILETKLLMATILKRYDLTLEPGQDYKFTLSATLSYENGLMTKLSRRK